MGDIVNKVELQLIIQRRALFNMTDEDISLLMFGGYD
jgi:hypothetical protein